jgi:hypothetical protein
VYSVNSANTLCTPGDCSSHTQPSPAQHGNTRPCPCPAWPQKAAVLYDAIAASGGFYNTPVDPAVRSLMNVPFTIPSKPELEAVFIKEAAAQGMVSQARRGPRGEGVWWGWAG